MRKDYEEIERKRGKELTDLLRIEMKDRDEKIKMSYQISRSVIIEEFNRIRGNVIRWKNNDWKNEVKDSYLEAELRIRKVIDQKWEERSKIKVERSQKKDIIIVKKQPEKSVTLKRSDKQITENIKKADIKTQPIEPKPPPKNSERKSSEPTKENPYHEKEMQRDVKKEITKLDTNIPKEVNERAAKLYNPPEVIKENKKLEAKQIDLKEQNKVTTPKQLEHKITAAKLGKNLPREVDGRTDKIYNPPNVTK
jgi:hypothetical protein